MEETGNGSENEQIPEEGEAPAEEEITPVIPSEEVVENPTEEVVVEDPAEEVTEPAEEVVDPTTDPEATAEETVVDEMIDAKGDTYATLTIANYLKLKDQVTFTPGAGLSISSKGVITARAEEGVAKTGISLTIEAKDGYKITSVRKGDEPVTGSGTYTVTLETGEATVSVETVATYTAKVTIADEETSGSITVTTGEAASEGAEAPTEEIAKGASKTLEKGRAMVFTATTTPAADASKRLKVYYKADGMEQKEIPAVTTGEGNAAKTTYTVAQSVIDSLDEDIEIVLELEGKVAVTIDTTGSQVSAAPADIEVEVPDTAEGAAADAKKWDQYAATGTANNTVFPGETFKFRVKANANYAIKNAVLTDDEDEKNKTDLGAGTVTTQVTGADAVTWVVYEVEPTTASTVTFETEFDSAKKSTINFTLTGNDGSATAAITGVTPVADADDEDNPTEAEIMAAALGLADATALTLTAGTPLDILTPTGTGAKVEVTVTPAAGYALKAPTGMTLEANGTLKFTFTTFTQTLNVAVETEAAATKGSHYFAIKRAASGSDEIKSWTVDTTDANVEKADGTTADDTYYLVKEGAKTIKVTVDVTEGYKLTKPAIAYSDVREVSTTSEVTKYEVLLMANKLNVTTASAYADAQAIELADEAISYSVTKSEDCSKAGYDVRYFDKDNNDKTADYEEIATASLESTLAAFPYNHALKAKITPAPGYTLESVSYTMGGGDAVTVPVVFDDSDPDGNWGYVANLEIAKVTGDVEITVTTKAEAVKLGALQKVTGITAAATFEPMTSDDNTGIYDVDHDGRYAVDVVAVGETVDAKDVSVVVKDATGATVAMSTPIATDKDDRDVKKRSFNLANKNLEGQEITAEVSYQGEYVGTYIMQVSDKATELSVNGGTAITQSVDSVKTYPIVTNSTSMTAYVKNEDDATYGSPAADTFAALIDAVVVDGELVVTIDPAKQSQVADSTTTGSGDAAVPTWTSKVAVIKVEDDDDPDIYDEVEITATPLFAENAKATLSVDSAADVLFNVTVGTGAAQAPQIGRFVYTVTAASKAPGQGETFPTDKLETSGTFTSNTKDTSASGKLYVGKSSNLGEGAAWAYDLTATVQYYNGSMLIQTLELTGVDAVSASTEVPVFEDVLKLKKTKNTTFYTGWNDKTYESNEDNGPLAVATPTWKNGKYQVIDEVWVNGDPDIDVDIVNGEIVVERVGSYVKPGKYTITALATRNETGKNVGMGSEHMSYAARATTTITVVQGINDIDLSAPSASIYKKDAKSKATLKVGLTYNYYHGDSKNGKWVPRAPKTKKVNWEIVALKADGSEDTSESAYIKQYVTVKNGTVTVDKSFVRDERHKNNNKFIVRVTANDFAGNNAVGKTTPIEVKTEKLEISKIALVQDTDKGYKVVAVQDGKTVQSVKATDVDGAYIVPLGANSDVTLNREYASWAQFTRRNDIIPASDVVVASSNKKVAEIDGDNTDENDDAINTLNVLAANKKVNITVTAQDGGKSKQTLPLNLGFTDLEGKDLSIDIKEYASNKVIYEAKKVEKDGAKIPMTVNGSADLYVYVKVGDKTGEASTNFTYADNYTNYKLAVKGGKKIYDQNGIARITTTSEVTTITLTNPNVAKGEQAKVYTYTLTNAAYDKKSLTAAPKIAVKGSLYTSAKPEEQVVTMTANGVTGDLYARVEADWSALGTNRAKNSQIGTFNSVIQSNETGAEAHFFKINKDTGAFDLTFKANNYGMTRTILTAGSYKVKVTIGTGATETAFRAKYLPANATVKVAKTKAYTFKPTTFYTINKVDGGAILGGKTNAKAGELTVDFKRLENFNKKGAVNNFTHYFKVVEDEVTKVQRLTLNTDDDLVKKMLYKPVTNAAGEPTGEYTPELLNDNPVINIPKDDLTGYIYYTVTPQKGYFSNDIPTDGVAKITVKIAAEAKAGKAAKATQKYVPSNSEIKLTKDATTAVNISVNGSYVSVAYAMIDDSKKGNAAELTLDGLTTTNSVQDVSGTGEGKGRVIVKATGALEEGKKYSTNLLVVPNNSWYAQIIAKAPATASTPAATTAEGETTPAATTTQTKTDLIKLYGIPVKITITAKATAAETPEIVPPTTTPTTPEGPTTPENPDTPNDPGKDELTAAQIKTKIAALFTTGSQKDYKIANGKFTGEQNGKESTESGATMGTAADADLQTAIMNALTTGSEALEGFNASDWTIEVTFTVTKNPKEDTNDASNNADGAATMTVNISNGQSGADVGSATYTKENIVIVAKAATA